MNHVVSGDEKLRDDETTEVPVLTLGEILKGASPTVIKMDVEGYEKQVIEGAGNIFSNSTLRAVIMEINTHEDRYQYKGSDLLQTMLEYGFRSFRYRPHERLLVPWSATGSGDNVVFVREFDWLLERVKSAPRFEIQRLRASI
jgi:hypothetical protein